MTDQTERYDRIAKGYDRWWAPVLAPTAAALLDRMAPVLEGGVVDLLDVGVGTGNLAIAAVERWPDVQVMGVDASGEMVRVVRSLAAERLLGRDGDRFQARVGFAAEMPFEDGSFDAAMSSFVLQLVPSRPKALREVRRVLRPGGTFAYVTWIRDNRPFAPDRIFDELLAEFGFDEEEDDRRSGDLPSVARAAAELRRAGFRDVTAEGALLEHIFTVDGYIAFLVEFDEESLFEEMARTERRRFLARFREQLMALSQDQLTFRVPIVYASGRRGPA